MEPLLFGQILLNFNLVTEADLNRCLNIQRHIGERKHLGKILVEEGLLDEEMLSTILTVQKGELDGRGSALGLSTHDLDHALSDATATDYLQVARNIGASDCYLTSNKTPMVRLHGYLLDLPAPRISELECEYLLFSLLTPRQQERYRSDKHLDFCASLPEVGRFRVNVFRHHSGIGAVFRILPTEVRALQDLGLPRVVHEFTDMKHGLVLITGSTGSGKTTTLAAIVDRMNKRHKRHIVTLEDPIETVFQSEECLITQREIGTHTTSFADGLRAALREDTDVIVVGELRDPETFAAALTAAETGHLVFGTLHTRSAHGTIMRVIEQFPATQRAHVRTMLAGTLRAVICQELIPNIDGKGRTLATEVMMMNPAISNLIREDRTWQIPMVMQTHSTKGMTLMDDSLQQLVRQKLISLEEAVCRAKDPDKFVVPA